MKWRIIARTGLYAGLGLLPVLLLFWQQLGAVIVWEYWTREHPLVHPVSVTTVRDGKVTLEDGRSFHPAGIVRRNGVTPEEYDRALIAMVAQGVVIARDLGDGRAFLVAEPKFYNWCGTHDPFRHWAGISIQCLASEALVYAGYAAIDLNQTGLSARERWRLEGVTKLQEEPEPVRISESKAFRFRGNDRRLSNLDDIIEVLWEPPPQ